MKFKTKAGKTIYRCDNCFVKCKDYKEIIANALVFEFCEGCFNEDLKYLTYQKKILLKFKPRTFQEANKLFFKFLNEEITQEEINSWKLNGLELRRQKI